MGFDQQCMSDARHARKRHLPTQQQHEGLEQQGKSGELAGPRRTYLRNLPVGQLHPRHSHLKLALVLEQVQVPVGLRHRVVHGVLPVGVGDRKVAADLEIHADVQLSLARLEAHPDDVSGRADAQRRLEYLLGDQKIEEEGSRPSPYKLSVTHSEFKRGQ
jgi:hypothetical protein